MVGLFKKWISSSGSIRTTRTLNKRTGRYKTTTKRTARKPSIRKKRN